MNNIAVYAGSFNPIHPGHLSVIAQACNIFDKVIVLIANNPSKTYAVSVDTRKKFIEGLIKSQSFKSKVVIDYTNESLVSYCEKHDVNFIIKGIRNGNDLEYEQTQMEYCRLLSNKEIQWVFITTYVEYKQYSSSAIRQFIQYSNLDKFVALYEKTWKDCDKDVLKNIYESYSPNKPEKLKCPYCKCEDFEKRTQTVKWITHTDTPKEWLRQQSILYCKKCGALVHTYYEDEVNK